MPYNPQIHHRWSIRLQGYDYSQEGLYFITICCQNMICRFGTIENGVMILNEYGNIAYNEWIKLSERFGNFELDVFQIMPNHMHGIISLHAPVRATLAVAQNTNRNVTGGAGFTPAPNKTYAQNDMGAANNPVMAGFIPAPNENDAEKNMGGSVEMKMGGASDVNMDGGAEMKMEEGADRRATARVARADMEGEADAGADRGADIGATARVARTAMGEAAAVSDIVGAYKSLVANGCLEIFKARNEIMGKLWQRNYYEHIIRDVQAYHRISEYIINNPAKWSEDKFCLK